MKNDLFKNKIFVIITGIVVGIAILYFIFIRNSDEVDMNTPGVEMGLVFSDPMEEILGRQIINALNKINDVKMDVDFLQSPVFSALQDLTVPIPAQNIGRRDPFANIGAKFSSDAF